MSVRITDLPEANSLTGAELTVVVQSGVTKRSTAGSAPVSAAQQAALDLKVDKITGKGLSTEDYTTAEKSKLAGIESGAQVNVATNLTQGTRTATTVPVTSSTGTAAILQAATTSLAGVMVSADKAKLDGIATAATANATDAALRDRTTHTGVQAINTVTGLQAALNHLQLTAALGI